MYLSVVLRVRVRVRVRARARVYGCLGVLVCSAAVVPQQTPNNDKISRSQK